MSRSLGREAEDSAAIFLADQGYTILKRRYKSRSGEIDIVALDGDVLVMVEVKMRTAGEAEFAVDAAKQAHIRASAAEYLVFVGEPNRTVRYDVIAIDRTGIRHHVDAFR